ncbi:hypothetical protein M9H77_07675 [Catharanthus roseus]|uniref:Uncharacterized protein n=1 Tax=Catharanthus roseus TaxID=4058 RepID=A0ACC0BVT3_CATRO|nr:hypothetical protein M9H77_07675 [Catharanthus roseus]
MFSTTCYYVPKKCIEAVLRSGLSPWSLTFVLHVLLNLGVETALMCLDSLRLPNSVRTPHIVFPGFSYGFGTCSLVPRGMLVLYSATVNLVEWLGVSQVVSEEIILERGLVPVVDLSDDESVEGLTAQGVEFREVI